MTSKAISPLNNQFTPDPIKVESSNRSNRENILLAFAFSESNAGELSELQVREYLWDGKSFDRLIQV